MTSTKNLLQLADHLQRALLYFQINGVIIAALQSQGKSDGKKGERF